MLGMDNWNMNVSIQSDDPMELIQCWTMIRFVGDADYFSESKVNEDLTIQQLDRVCDSILLCFTVVHQQPV
jgi:hypothetical protein